MKSTYTKRNGHERTRFTKASTNWAATDRRKVALASLEKQLQPLDPEKDKHHINRIKKEIAILQERIR